MVRGLTRLKPAEPVLSGSLATARPPRPAPEPRPKTPSQQANVARTDAVRVIVGVHNPCCRPCLRLFHGQPHPVQTLFGLLARPNMPAARSAQVMFDRRHMGYGLCNHLGETVTACLQRLHAQRTRVPPPFALSRPVPRRCHRRCHRRRGSGCPRAGHCAARRPGIRLS